MEPGPLSNKPPPRPFERARRLPAALLDESVDDEWSFLQTLRHLIHATDRWITGPVLAEPEPVHALGMPNPPYEDLPPGVFDLEACPTLAEVLVVRHGRMNAVKNCVGGVSAAQLDREVSSPNGGKTTVRRCLHVVFREEWWHNQYATRDLTVLDGGTPTTCATPAPAARRCATPRTVRRSTNTPAFKANDDPTLRLVPHTPV